MTAISLSLHPFVELGFTSLFDMYVNTTVKFRGGAGRRFNLLEHPNVVSGNSNVVPGAVNREWVLDAIHKYTAPAEGCSEAQRIFEVPVWLCGKLSDKFPAIEGIDRFRVADKFFWERVLECDDPMAVTANCDCFVCRNRHGAAAKEGAK